MLLNDILGSTDRRRRHAVSGHSPAVHFSLHVAALLVLAGLWLSSPAACAVTPADYSRQLHSYSGELSAALDMEKEDPGSSRKALAGLAERTPASIRVGQGQQTVKSDLTWLRKGLDEVRRTPAKDRGDQIGKLLARLQTYQAAALNVPESDLTSVTHARTALTNILQKLEYRPSRLDQLSRRVMQAVFDALSKVNLSRGAVEIIGWILAAVAVIVFVTLLVLVTMRLIAHFSCRQVAPVAGRNVAARQARQSLEILVAQAEQDASEGRYSEAFRQVYLAALLLLDRARLVTYTDSGTNWEYLRALRRQGAEEPSNVFHRMTLLFDRLIYGKRDVTQDDYLVCLHEFRRLEEAV